MMFTIFLFKPPFMINVRFYMFNKCYKIKKFLFPNVFKILIQGLQQYRNNDVWYLSVRLKVHVCENTHHTLVIWTPLLYFIRCVWNEPSDTVLYYLGKIYRKWWKFEIFFLSCKMKWCIFWIQIKFKFNYFLF